MAKRILLKDMISKSDLKVLIEDTLGRNQQKAPANKNPYIRASSMHSVCPREEVLCALHEVYRDDVISPGLELIFDLGHGMHWAMQNIILPEVGVLLGKWRCLTCGKVHGREPEGDETVADTVVLRPEACDRCEATEFLYDELMFLDTEYKVGGHPDGFIKLPDREDMGILEVKSISSGSAWKVKDFPDFGHVVQTHVYMWLTGLQWVNFLYWNKGEFGMSAIISHVVERDEDTVDLIKNTLVSIWEGIENKEPPKGICRERTCPRAKDCQVVEQCFG